MELTANRKHFEHEPAVAQIVSLLENSQTQLGIERSQLYYKFPLYKDAEGEVVESRLLLVSPEHGLLILWTIEEAAGDPAAQVDAAISQIDQVYTSIVSRLIRNKALRKGRELGITVEAAIYAPVLSGRYAAAETTTKVLTTDQGLCDFIESNRHDEYDETTFSELLSTLQGAKGLIRARERPIQGLDPKSKGALAASLEAEISLFDKQQKHAYTSILAGVQRIRGLAGSGKTVLLALKAAVTHLREPGAVIAYTFYTKSLYQHVQRLITRFYRQFDDRDPDWEKIRILHGWGGHSTPGLYFDACRQHGVPALSLDDASQRTVGNPFDYACKQFMETSKIQPIYDYTFIDEGQDFPVSFVRLCRSLTLNESVVWAYDELQTIFDITAPSAGDVFGLGENGAPLSDFSDDIVLYKCYRSPREILVCAHALGFGLYGSRIVQMLENVEHWEDIGYKVVSGELSSGSSLEIERPAENSLKSLSEKTSIDDLVRADVFNSFEDEVAAVVKSIEADVSDGLRPDDILVISVDNYKAKTYLWAVAAALAKRAVRSNNVHADQYGVKNFFVEGHVTLSTVYKAKGNEAYMVYILGVNSLYSRPTVRTRNTLFTAMTRTKGWVRISGVGKEAQACQDELGKAKKRFPFLRFTYPTEAQFKVMKRDLQKAALEKQKLDRIFDELLAQLSPEEIRQQFEQRVVLSRKNHKKRRSK